MKKIVIRADGNDRIGSGHIMRCISISNAAQKAGMEVLFITADKSFLSVLEANKLEVCILNSIYTKLNEEIDLIRPILNEEKPDYILVDSYFVTDEYLKVLREYAPIAYIDDVLAFPYSVDFLVNYNIYASKNQYEKLYDGCDAPHFLLGGQFTPLREEFQSGDVIKIKSIVSDIFFSAGGSDSEHIAIKFVEKVSAQRDLDDINFHIVMGSFESDKDAIQDIAFAHKNIITYQNVKKMSELMRRCDIAISAAGSTLYELCACGVPTITYVLADNQISGATTFEEKGLMINAGDDRKDQYLMDGIIKNMICLSKDYDRRLSIQNEMKKCIKSNGALQIVKGIVGD